MGKRKSRKLGCQMVSIKILNMLGKKCVKRIKNVLCFVSDQSAVSFAAQKIFKNPQR